MNIYLTPIGSGGDNYPFIGLGLELSRRGHRVTMVINGHFAPLARRCGLHVIPIGTDEEYREIASDKELFHPRRGFNAVMRRVSDYNARLLRVLQDHVDPRSSMVVCHSLDFASRCWQERHNLPVVTVHLQPSLMRSEHQVPTLTGRLDLSNHPRWVKRWAWRLMDRFIIDPAIGPLINEQLRAPMGLKPVTRPFQEWIHSPLLTIGLFPEWFASPQPDWPGQVRLTGFPLFDAPDVQATPEAVEQFLQDGPPPVVFTPGTAYLYGDRFFRTAVEACRRTGRRGILLSRHREHVPRDLPGTVLHVDFAPLSDLLPRCAALVHHGGIGTTAAALAGGVPQIIMPMSHDQPDNANRIMKLGAGDRLFPRQFKPRRLGAVLDRLIGSPQVQARCAELADRLRQANGIAESCDWIESVMAPDMSRLSGSAAG